MQEITVREAAKASGKSLTTIRSWVKTGKIKGFKKNGKSNAAVYVNKRELLDYLAKNINPDKSPDVSIENQTSKYHDKYIDTLERMNESLKRETTALKDQLNQANNQLLELTQKAHSLELELSSVNGFSFRKMLKAAFN